MSLSFLRLLPSRPALCLALPLALSQMPARAAEDAVVIPPPAVDAPAKGARETAILAGGCFWGVQGVFQHVKGVSNAVSGYAGGEAATANYEEVSAGSTGHAEAVQVTFDPRVISYGHLLQIFFSVAHDPTQLNRQGPDTGRQYRSAIFPTTPEQAEVAKAYIAQLEQGRRLSRAHRHGDRGRQGVLPGGGLPPGLPGAEPDLPLHRHQRPSQGRQFEEALP